MFEFSVNDGGGRGAQKTSEGLVRKILARPNAPALLMLHMMRKGNNVQQEHGEVGDHYNLPRVSYRDGLWPEVQADRLAYKQVTADAVHANNAGHAWAARFVSVRYWRFRRASMARAEAWIEKTTEPLGVGFRRVATA